MQKPDTQRATLRMEAIWNDAEERIMQDVVRRIRQNGKITSTADYQINQLARMGKSTEEIETETEITIEVPFLDKPLNDFTTSEGLLLLIFILAFIGLWYKIIFD